MKKHIGDVITDIVLVGSVDTEIKPAEISINHEYLYFQLNDENWVKLISIDQMSVLKIVDSEGLDFLFEIDEDDEYTSVSIRDSILIDTVSDVAIASVDEYSVDGKVKALEVTLKNDQSIFIDATYYTGIKLGENALKKAFIENHSGFVKG